jgi:hypothetical protein
LCRDFEFVAYRQNWGEDRVHLHDENGELFCVPAGWTDVAPADPFAVIADDRCPFTVDGLLALADLIGRLLLERREVAEVADALGPLTQKWFRDRLLALPGRGYEGAVDQDAFDYTWYWFERMRAFFRKTAGEGRAMLFTADQ